MTKIIKQFEGFVSETYPDFFYSDHPQFQTFLDAYFEWLEKDNTAEATNSKDIFKSVPNAAALINHVPEYRDVDISLRQFLDYFKREIIPFKLEETAVPDPFLIKKMREVYLAKGALKSYELLFKMLYNEDIEAYETRDFIIEASEGNYQNIIVCYFKVKDRQSDFDNIDFNLSGVYDSENGDLKVTILDITPIGYVDSDNKLLFLAQLAVNEPLKIGSNWIIKNAATPGFFVEVQTVPSLSSIKVTNSAGFSDTDVIIIKSKSTSRSTTATISTKQGPVTHLFFRNRGYGYQVGDEFVFTSAEAADGDGATAKVTAVDTHGRITEVDGVPVRTGENNNGLLTNNFEEGYVKLITQGRYKEFPTVTIDSKSDTVIMQPYGGTETGGFGAQVAPYSQSIGAIKEINTLSAGVFEDSDDVEIVSPAFVRLYNPDSTIQTGNIVVLQQFMPDSEALLRDSDTVVMTISLSSVSSLQKTYRIPYGFDSETWTWKSANYTFGPDSDGFQAFRADWDSDAATIKSNELTRVTFDSDTIVLKMEGPMTWAMDEYHWEQLDAFSTDDSEFSFSYVVTHGNPRTPESSSSGYWRTTQYRAEVYRTKGDEQIYLLPYGDYPFATTGIINALSAPRNTILRLAVISFSSGELIYDNNLTLSNIISQWSKPDFDFRLNAVWQTDKRFVDDAGFLNSPSSGVLQDGYVYSYFTYLIQSMLPVGRWRKIVKDTLHPAGMIMISELKYSPESTVTPELAGHTEYGFYKQSSVFDAAQDYYGSYRAPASAISQVYADTVVYTVDSPNVYDELNVDGQTLLADHQASVEPTTFYTTNGNAFWDFEPIGLVKEESINDTGIDQTVQNFDVNSLLRKVTTQNQTDDSDKVIRESIYYNIFDGTSQDMYKTSGRLDRGSVGILRTWMTEHYYDTYDSDFEPYFYARFSDSDSEVLTGIDYNRLKSTNDTRTFQGTTIKRMFDLQKDQELDLQKAMREDGSLSFTDDSDNVTYYDFEAYERKWNYYNSDRVANENGGSQWQVPGYTSWLLNRGTHDNGNPRYSSWKASLTYADQKVPYRNVIWYVEGDSDNLLWTNSYVPPINTKTVTLIHWDDSADENNVTYRDPHLSMRGRRGS